MKKVLFATTALVATASVAAADVTFSGYARFGVLYNDEGQLNANGTTDSSTDVTSRLRFQVDMTAESDAGVTFGARTRFQTAEGDGDTGMNGIRFFARSGGLEVGVGNIFGALESMTGQYTIDLGLTGLGYDYTAYNFRADLYSSGGAGDSGDNGVEVIYSFAGFGVHVSASDTDDRIAAAFDYSIGGFEVGVGLQDSDNAGDTEWVLAAEGDVGFATIGAAYARNGDDDGVNGDHYALMARFDVGAATDVEVFVADADYFGDTAYGIDFNHDMGGGTSLRGGVAKRGAGNTIADLGVRFNF